MASIFTAHTHIDIRIMHIQSGRALLCSPTDFGTSICAQSWQGFRISDFWFYMPLALNFKLFRRKKKQQYPKKICAIFMIFYLNTQLHTYMHFYWGGSGCPVAGRALSAVAIAIISSSGCQQSNSQTASAFTHGLSPALFPPAQQPRWRRCYAYFCAL